MKKKLLCFLFLTCFCIYCHAQQVVSTSGSVAVEGLSVDWILGGSLIDISTLNTTTLAESPLEFFPDSVLLVKVYPTLTKDYTTIEISSSTLSLFYLEIYNNSGGKILDRINMTVPSLKLDLGKFAAGVYYLKVFVPERAQAVKIEKIIKI